MNLEAGHMRVLRRMKQVGTPVQFVQDIGAYDEDTDTFDEPLPIVVKGHAVSIAGDPIEYEQTGLLLNNPVTILFVPDTLGERPAAESSIQWNGEARLAKKVKHLAVGDKVILV